MWGHTPRRPAGAAARELLTGWSRSHQLPVGAPASAQVDSAESSYTHFAYSYARSADEAYAKEWRNYDAFGGSHGLDNETQPVWAAG